MPGNVAEHYLKLSVDELIDDVLRHYRRNVWPKVEAIIAANLSDTTTTGIVLEGSAIWPDFASNLDFAKVTGVWFTASDELLQQRIHSTCDYTTKTPRERALIDQFIARTLAYNSSMVEVVDRNGLTLVDVTNLNVSELTQMCFELLGIEQV